MKQVISLDIRKREPANMVWDRYALDKRIAKAAAKLKAKNKKSTTDMAFVHSPHSV